MLCIGKLVAVATGFLLVGQVAEGQAPKKQGGGKAQQARGAAGAQWWREIDTGPFIADTMTTADGKGIVALKGLAIKLGAARDVSVVFDTELLAWRGGFD
eukprot:gene54322-74421_t